MARIYQFKCSSAFLDSVRLKLTVHAVLADKGVKGLSRCKFHKMEFEGQKNHGERGKSIRNQPASPSLPMRPRTVKEY